MTEKIYFIFQGYYSSDPQNSVGDFTGDFWSGCLARMKPEYLEELQDLFSHMVFVAREQLDNNGQQIITQADGRAFVGGTIKVATEVFPTVLADKRRENILLLMGERRDIALHLLCGGEKQICEALFSALSDETYRLETPNAWVEKYWEKYASLFKSTEGLPTSSSLSNWRKLIYPRLRQILQKKIEVMKSQALNPTKVHMSQLGRATSIPLAISFKFAIKRVIAEMFLTLFCIVLLWIYIDKDAVLFALLPYAIGIATIICILLINEYDKLRSHRYLEIVDKPSA